jgi:Ca2+-binding EF-hand superfamily protein
MSIVSGVSGGLSPQVISGASARQPLAQQFNSIFSLLTTPGSGVVTTDQFAQAFSSLNPPASFQSLGANAIFSALDPSNSGSITRQKFIQGMVSLSSQLNSQATPSGW